MLPRIGSLVSRLPSFYATVMSIPFDSTISAIKSLSPIRDPQIQLLLLCSYLGSCHLLYLPCSISPLTDILPPLRSFSTALT